MDKIQNQSEQRFYDEHGVFLGVVPKNDAEAAECARQFDALATEQKAKWDGYHGVREERATLEEPETGDVSYVKHKPVACGKVFDDLPWIEQRKAISRNAAGLNPIIPQQEALATIKTGGLISSGCGEMEVGDYSENITCTDNANGKRLARWCGNDLCYVVEHKQWYVWNGKRWEKDTGGIEITRRAKEIARAIFAEAVSLDEEAAKRLRQWAWLSNGKARLDAMIGLAESEGTIAKHASDFDTDACLFNCQNGVVNLKTGELLPHSRDCLMMNISPVAYSPGAECPTWLKFLDRIQEGDAGMIGFLQRLAGYSMVGSSEEETANFIHGRGRNGKGKFLDTLRRIMGDYATTLAFSALLEQGKHSGNGPNEGIANLAGKRMVIAQESNVTGRFNEALLKTLTGRDEHKAQFKYGHEFGFMPMFTLWLASNNKPRILDTTDGTKSRIWLIPFKVRIPDDEIDKKLPDKLWAEREGILAWCVRGAVAWNAEGRLEYPKQVKDATRDYFDEEDSIGQWLKECAEAGEGLESGSGLAFDSYREFAKDSGFHYTMDSKEFKHGLEGKGYENKKTNKGRTWAGFKVTRLGSRERVPELPQDVLE
jgi:putative DNA primase/helicase